MNITLIEYIQETGVNPYKRWFDRLNIQASVKVGTALLRLEMGNTSNLKWFGAIGELVIDWGPGYRVYLLKDDNKVLILLGGGTKRGQQKDIKRALALAGEYKMRRALLKERGH